MRSQHRSFFATMIIVSLCCGFVGCKLNSGGRWYNPKAYSYHNPFKKSAMEEDEYGQFAEDNSGIKLPKEGQIPELDTPAGGYSDDRLARGTSLPRAGTPSSSPYNNGPASYQSQTTPPPAVAMNGAGVQQTNYQTTQGQTMPSSGYTSNTGQYGQTPQGGAMQPVNPGYGQQPGYGTPYTAPASNQPQYTTPSTQGQGQGTYDSYEPQNGYATGQNYYTNTPTYDNPEYRPGSR